MRANARGEITAAISLIPKFGGEAVRPRSRGRGTGNRGLTFGVHMESTTGYRT